MQQPTLIFRRLGTPQSPGGWALILVLMVLLIVPFLVLGMLITAGLVVIQALRNGLRSWLPGSAPTRKVVDPAPATDVVIDGEVLHTRTFRLPEP